MKRLHEWALCDYLPAFIISIHSAQKYVERAMKSHKSRIVHKCIA